MRDWTRGKGAKSNYITSICVVSGILVWGVLAAILLYERPFSFLTVEISDLAVTVHSPIGGVIFAVSFVVAGILLLPHALTATRYYCQTSNMWAVLVARACLRPESVFVW